MPGGVTADAPRRRAQRVGFAETVLEKRGLTLDTGAPVTAAVTLGATVAAGFGDGTVRFFRPGLPPAVVPAHRGAVLCLAADGGHVLTGGDDGRCLRVSPEGAVEEVASFGTRWVDCVAAGGGWRLHDRADMRMSGYPGKVKSFAWVGAAPLLATSGAGEAVCWPFDGDDGPMGRVPATCAWGGQQLCTAVAGLVGLSAVFAGFQDGAVLAGRLSADAEDLVIRGSSGAPVTALAVTPEGWIFVGEQSGRAQWFLLGLGDA